MTYFPYIPVPLNEDYDYEHINVGSTVVPFEFINFKELVGDEVYFYSSLETFAKQDAVLPKRKNMKHKVPFFDKKYVRIHSNGYGEKIETLDENYSDFKYDELTGRFGNIEIDETMKLLIDTKDSKNTEHQPKPKPEVKHQPEPKPKPEAKHQPEPKPEVKHQPEPKPEPKPEVKHQPEPKPEVKHQPEPKPDAKSRRSNKMLNKIALIQANISTSNFGGAPMPRSFLKREEIHEEQATPNMATIVKPRGPRARRRVH